VPGLRPTRGRILTVPNQLTFLRLGFLPFYLIAVLYAHYGWALGLLIVAAVTDGMDGLLARWLHQKSAVGAYIDPIADKLLLSSSFLVLALREKVRWWLAIIVLSRDVLLLTTAVVILLVMGYRTFPPSFFGKATTLVQILFVFIVLSLAVTHWRWLAVLQPIARDAVAALTVFSGFHYSVIMARRLSASP
jgi:cardiolipin synthase (CMP-forming)